MTTNDLGLQSLRALRFKKEQGPVVRNQLYPACVPLLCLEWTCLVSEGLSWVSCKLLPVPASQEQHSDREEVASPGGSSHCLLKRGNLDSELAPPWPAPGQTPENTELVTHSGSAFQRGWVCQEDLKKEVPSCPLPLHLSDPREIELAKMLICHKRSSQSCGKPREENSLAS
jgi:hypothetical protein